MPLLDIGIVLEDRTQADYTVEIYNEDILLSELRKQMVDECEINFEFKFILPGAKYFIIIILIESLLTWWQFPIVTETRESKEIGSHS